ncbi:unnamed protein product [Rotaria socialis]|uniref:Uncharacterized protein n=1 Tax=Rotaria socialis TaxID=392032 RepID=A0A821MYE5_9BILA|nr:unnamed protein product [Rotaria socialis]CAF3418225.1 unnamed protein product [Rotaria socialis]CAF4334453.1 unnamed protein product [Rotaria socialis]CAF4774902.1 unnamed protein product [Rotaria socialis]
MASLVNGIIGEQYTKVHEDNRINNDIQQSSAQILDHPLSKLFSYYWRLDTHSYTFGGQPIEDPFEIIQKRKIQYAFTMANRGNEAHTLDL